MTETTEDEFSFSLDPELLQEIFPISPRDRRKNHDLFAPFVEGQNLKDDLAFYTGLLSMIEGPGIDALRRYDRRMDRAKNTKKTFGFRAIRFLIRNGDAHGGRIDVDVALEMDFLPGCPEASIQSFFKKLISNVTEQDAVETDDTLAEWRDLATRIAELALGMETADTDAAEHILSMANALVEACQAEKEQQSMRNAEWLAQIQQRLAAFDQTIPAAALSAQDSERLEAFEEALKAAEDAQSGALAANEARDELNAQAREAQDDGDLEREEQLIPLRRAALDRCKAAQQLASKTAEVLRSLLSVVPVHDLANDTPLNEPAGTTEDRDDEGDESEADPEGVLTGNDQQGGQLPDELVAQPAAEEALDGETGHVDGETALLEPEQDIDTIAEVTDGERNTSATAETGAEAGPEEERAAPGETAVEEPASCQADAATVYPEVQSGPTGQEDDSNSTSTPPPVKGTLTRQSQPARLADDTALMVQYLAADELAFAWQLSRLCEDQGRPLAIPAAVIRGLAVLRRLNRAEEMADPRRIEAMTQMMDALPEAADQAAAQRLVLAALLRPALFDPDHGARGLVGTLHLGASLPEPLAPLVQALADLGYDVRLSAPLLAELVSQKTLPATPAAVTRLQDWLTQARSRKCMHQPTYSILHRELKGNSVLGEIIEAAIAGTHAAEKQAQEFVSGYIHNRGAQEEFVAEAERRSGRPRQDRIEGQALDWFCERLQEACEALSDWLAARQQDAGEEDWSHERLTRAIAPLRKLFSADPVLSQPPTPLAAAADRAVLRALEDVRRLLSGEGATATASRRPRALLGVPLLRLPGGCQDWTDGDPSFAQERHDRDRRLLAALRRPESISADLSQAFEDRLQDNAILAAQALLAELRAVDASGAAFHIQEQRLAEAEASARSMARARVEKLRQEFTKLGYLDLDASADLQGDQGALARLSAITEALAAGPDADSIRLPANEGRRAPEVPPDFPELDDVLGALEKTRDDLRRAIAGMQRNALEALGSGLITNR